MLRFTGPALALALVACAQGHTPRTGRGDAGDMVRTDAGGGCPAGQRVCDRRCTDVQSDPANCGACGIVCSGGFVCSAGVCGLFCGPGLEACSGSCRDVATDPMHCGGCGTACAPGELCMSGACATSCPGGQILCGGGCRDTTTDRSHCGGCDIACGAGEICTGGACVLSCPPGQTACAGTCRDLMTDEMHCGACSAACGAGELCSAGTCAPVCGPGLTNCAGSCVDTASSPMHCGGCGLACAMGEICTSGACMPMVIPPESYPFPQSGDTRNAAGGGVYFWRLGDYVEGSRTTGISTIGGLDVHLIVDPNVLTCDTQDVAVKVNGITVGTFSIASGVTTIDRSYSFGAIAGPTYVVRYETTRQVASGCGSGAYPDGRGSTVTFRAP